MAHVLRIVDRLKSERVRSSTRRNYYSVWKNFNEFFIRLDVKPNTWEDRIVLFIAHLIESDYKSQTVSSYLSAIQGVLAEEGVQLNEDKFLLSSLIRACRLKNDKIRTRLPKQTAQHFMSINQEYLATLYCSLFATAYFGMFRVGALMAGEHPILVNDVHIGENKNKVLFTLRTSKTHGRGSKPQIVK